MNSMPANGAPPDHPQPEPYLGGQRVLIGAQQGSTGHRCRRLPECSQLVWPNANPDGEEVWSNLISLSIYLDSNVAIVSLSVG
jgi:hypothetical protein